MKLLLLLSFICCLSNLAAQAPRPTLSQQAQARAVLNRKGIDEAELRARLLARGIDVDRMSTAELLAAQTQIEAVIAEIEAEQVEVDPSPSLSTGAPQAQLPLTRDSLLPIDTLTLLPDTTLDAVWGHALFRNQSLAVYQAGDQVRPPNSYRLGVGDAVAVSIFGASQADLKFIIDQEGFIRPPSMPRIYLKGIPLGQASKLVEDRFRQYYRFQTGQFSFTVDAARTITVNIFGETQRNGSFTISAVNTAFNALAAAGGPKAGGSVRQIKLLRDGQEQLIDLYAFLMNPGLQADFFLENNDVIFVPLAAEIAQVEGAVGRPMRYEIKAGETVADLLRYAGGLLPEAAAESATLLEISAGREQILNLDLLRDGGAYTFGAKQASTDFNPLVGSRRGYVLRVQRRRSDERSFVTISGAVAVAGEYAYTEGMGLRDLVNKGQLLASSRQDVAFLRRQNPDSTLQLLPIRLSEWLENPMQTTDFQLQRGDELLVLSAVAFARSASITVTGAVRDTLTNYPYSSAENLTVADAILLAGGLQENASNEAFLIRINPANTQQKQYVRLDITTEAGLATKLRPNDELRVFRREKFSDPFPVSVRGAVRTPGTYTYDPSLGLADLLTLAGGTKLEAALNKIDVFRLEIAQNENTKTISRTLELDADFNIISGASPDFSLQPYDVVVVRSVPEFELIQTVKVNGAVRYPGDYALDSRNLRLNDLVQKSGGLTVEAFPAGATLYRTDANIGYVVVRLAEALKDPSSVANITLKDGDILEIPKALDLVSIRPRGTQANEIYEGSLLEDGTLDVAFSGEKSAKWYIDNFAAGFNKDARRSSLTIQYPNGELGKSRKFLFLNTYPNVRPGSSIQIALKPAKKERKAREEPIDWVGISQVTLGGLTTMLTLYLLIQRTNQP